MKLFSGKKVTVMGLGEHGGAIGNIRWLHEQGAKVTVTDLKPEAELRPALQKLQDLPDITWVLGEHREQDFINTSMVLQNPAVRRESPYLEKARAAGVPVEMDSSLFFKLSPTKNIYGVTGSKGKSTTTHTVSHILKLRFANVVTIGMEGTSPLAAISQLHPGDAAVFELSSWRLEALDEYHLSPATAIVTSLYNDHLNTYETFDDYAHAKQTVIRYQTIDDLAILNYDDELVRQWDSLVPGNVAWYSLGSSIPNDNGICVERGIINIATSRGLVPLFPLSAIPAESEHGQRNFLPAIYLAFCEGVPIESIKLQVSNTSTLSHRLEKIRVLNNITFVNDSAATIPDATIAAIRSFKPKPLVLIMGGSDKRLRFETLASTIREANIRGIILLPGTATDRLEMTIHGAYRLPPPILRADSMAKAVEQAHIIAQEGDIVLLSPAAASFGLFQHEFDRGNQFRQAAEALT